MDAVKRDRTINWPPDSNRDSIARELDSLRLPSKLRLALKTIFDLQWPPDKPVDWRPGHVLIKVPLKLLKVGTGKRNQRTVMEIPEQLAAEGCIEYVPRDGQAHLMSLDWDNLFGVDSAWRAAREELDPIPETAPAQSGDCTGAVSQPNHESSPIVELIAALKANTEARKLQVETETRLAAAYESFIVHVRALELTQSDLSLTPRQRGRGDASEASEASPVNTAPVHLKTAPVHLKTAPVHLKTAPVQSQNCTGAVSFMNHDHEDLSKFMNHDHDARDPKVHRCSPKSAPVQNQTAPVQSRRQVKPNIPRAKSWAFPDPYFKILDEHLRSPEHRAQMLNLAIEMGILASDDVTPEKWDQMAEFALYADRPGSAFKANIERHLSTLTTASRRPIQDQRTIDELSLDECQSILRGNFFGMQKFLELRNAGKDPRKNEMVRADLERALKRPKLLSST